MSHNRIKYKFCEIKTCHFTHHLKPVISLASSFDHPSLSYDKSRSKYLNFQATKNNMEITSLISLNKSSNLYPLYINPDLRTYFDNVISFNNPEDLGLPRVKSTSQGDHERRKRINSWNVSPLDSVLRLAHLARQSQFGQSQHWTEWADISATHPSLSVSFTGTFDHPWRQVSD